MENRDISNFSSSPHRLPTLSASQALQNLSSVSRKPISTGLKSLDAILQGKEPGSSDQDGVPGGLSRGHVTEIYGPPGVGKTTLAMQISANALLSSTSVVWIDASYELAGPRFKEILSNAQNPKPTSKSSTPTSHSTNELLKKFHKFTTPTLPHLLVLLTHPTPNFPPQGTSLIIIDSISTLITLAFPKPLPPKNPPQPPTKQTPNPTQWATSRKWPIMSDIISKLTKLAATQNLAILLTSQTTTKIRPETGATLHPATSASTWDSGIRTRLVLFRDWPSQTNPSPILTSRFIGIIKANGILHPNLEKTIPFIIKTSGLLQSPHPHPHPLTTPIQAPTKRKHTEIAHTPSQSDTELSDHEIEDEFGWAGDDERSLMK